MQTSSTQKKRKIFLLFAIKIQILFLHSFKVYSLWLAESSINDFNCQNTIQGILTLLTTTPPRPTWFKDILHWKYLVNGHFDGVGILTSCKALFYTYTILFFSHSHILFCSWPGFAYPHYFYNRGITTSAESAIKVTITKIKNIKSFFSGLFLLLKN